MRGVCGINARSVFQLHAVRSLTLSAAAVRSGGSQSATGPLRGSETCTVWLANALHQILRWTTALGGGFETTPMFEQTFPDPTGGSLPQQ